MGDLLGTVLQQEWLAMFNFCLLKLQQWMWEWIFC